MPEERDQSRRPPEERDQSRRPREERGHLLARLREEIRRIERRPGRREGLVACGLPAIDSLLPGGGFPRGAFTELHGGPASGKTAVALSLLAALSPECLCAWVDGRGDLYPPAAAARGVDLARLLVVRPPGAAGRPSPAAEWRRWGAALWSAEALLGSGAFTVVIVDVPLPRAVKGLDAIARRLQAAAELGGVVGLWVSTPPVALRIPAAVRLEISKEGERIMARRAGGATASGDDRAA
jgi:protein ImuA